MLRITTVYQDASATTLKLEGKVHAEWVAVLEEECLRQMHLRRRVLLDFSEVSYIDPQGIEMVRNIPNGHIRIINCPAFIAELLDRGGQP